MKKILVVSATILVLAGLCVAVSAACAGNRAVTNTAQTAVTGLSATPANVYSRLWDFGNGASINSGAAMAAKSAGAGCGSTDISADAWEVSGCFAAGYSILADLINAGQFVNGCPANTDRMVILLEDTTGNYAVISKIGSAGTWDLDAVATQAAATPVMNITRTSAAGVSPVVFSVTLASCPAVSGGYAAADGAPGSPLITGYNLYYQYAATAPSNLLSGSWLSAATLPATDATTAGVSINLPTAGNTMYLLLVPTFESGFTGTYGQLFTAFGPTASPLFANVTADPATVAWTSGDESRVASYQAYYSPTINGTYKAIGQPVAALGSGHSYSIAYRVVGLTYYVKIKASKTDGTFTWSTPVKVTRLATEPKPLPGKLLPSKLGVRK